MDHGEMHIVRGSRRAAMLASLQGMWPESKLLKGFTKGVTCGSIIRVMKGDTGNLDDSSCGGTTRPYRMN